MNDIVELNEQLKNALELVGNTPLDEPEIFEAIDLNPPEKMKMDKLKVVGIALERSGLKHTDFTALEIGAFFHEVYHKVSAFEDKEGVLKSVPSIENLRLPNFEDVENIQTKLESLQGIDLSVAKPEEFKDLTEKFVNQTTELNDMVWEIAGLDKSALSEWEQTLVVQHIFKFITEVEKTSMGKL